MKIKKNKLFLALIVSISIFASGLGLSYKAEASTVYDEFDILFRSTLTEIMEYENAQATEITAEKEMLYDIKLNLLGVVYSFSHSGKDGYAIIIHIGVPTVTEITMESQNPYQLDDTQKVYVALGTYWNFYGQNFYDCDTGFAISGEAYLSVQEFAFFGALELYYDSAQIDYTYRAENKYNILSSIPGYFYGLPSGCAAVAATNLIAYYDKTYPALIPNYDPGTLFLGIYRFKTANDTTNSLTEVLHSDMGTDSSGTRVTEFKNGLKKYVNRNGYSVSYTSIMSSGQINYESAKNTVQSNKALALFLLGFRTTTISTGTGYDTLIYEYAYENHVAAGFGCLEVVYTLTNGQSRTDKYIHCAMGVGVYRTGYINIATTKIDDALIINIS